MFTGPLLLTNHTHILELPSVLVYVPYYAACFASLPRIIHHTMSDGPYHLSTTMPTSLPSNSTASRTRSDPCSIALHCAYHTSHSALLPVILYRVSLSTSPTPCPAIPVFPSTAQCRFALFTSSLPLCHERVCLSLPVSPSFCNRVYHALLTNL